MARSVMKAQSHDEGRGGRSVTGVHGSAMGYRTKCIWGHQETSGIRSVTGAWLSAMVIKFTVSQTSGSFSSMPMGGVVSIGAQFS